MFSNFKNYYYKFLTTNIRLKLKFLKKKTKINFYPKYFKVRGFLSIYTRIIFILIMFEKFIKEIIIKYRIIFKTNYNYEKLYIINTFPRSGTAFLNNLIGSEQELSNNNGNGIPKYLNETDAFVFNENKNIIPITLFSECYNNLFFQDYRYFYQQKKKEYSYSNFFFSHHPIQINDLINSQENLKEVYLIREPLSSCLSNLKHSLNFDNFAPYDKKNNLNKTNIFKILITVCENYKLYFQHMWKLRNNKKKLLINYEDLTNETFKTVEKIYFFFGHSFNSENLEKAIKINSKDNTIKLLFKNIKNTNRLSNYNIGNKLEDELNKKVNEFMKKEINNYTFLFK